MRYEGCEIAIFAKPNSSLASSFRKTSAKAGPKVENLAGQPVTVFQERIDDDDWTTFIAFPGPNLALACTNRAYLIEVLLRIGGKIDKRAFPEDLPEWALVNTHAPFWALWHYDKTQAALDPTSPFRDQSIIGIADKRASAIALTFESGNPSRAKVLYFSGVADVLEFLRKKTPLCMYIAGVVDSNSELPIHYRIRAPGVAEIEYELGDAIPPDPFTGVVMAALGHAAYFLSCRCGRSDCRQRFTIRVHPAASRPSQRQTRISGKPVCPPFDKYAGFDGLLRRSSPRDLMST